MGFLDSSVSKESACNAGDPGSIPGSGSSPGEGIGYSIQFSWAFLVAQLVKNPPTMQETWVRSLVWKDPLEKGKATHSRISWTVHGVAKNRTGLSDFHFHFTSMGDECDCPMAWTLVLRFLGTGMRIDLFQSCGHCWVFQTCWHTECSTLMDVQ